MERETIRVTVIKTTLLEKTEIAEEAIRELCKTMEDLQYWGCDVKAEMRFNKTEDQKKAEELAGKKEVVGTTHICLTKNSYKDTEELEDHLEKTKALMESLKEAVKALDKAIITEIRR